MILTLARVHNNTIDNQENIINEGEIALSKKASRAFAISYVNEIYKTIKKVDPSALNNITITHKYPFYLYIFIQQEEPNRIKQLDIYSEQKYHGDGLSEVREIYHEAQHDPSYIRKKKKDLVKESSHWRWTALEIPKMYTMAISEGKKVGMSIYNRYVLSFGWLYPKSFVHQPNMNFPAHKMTSFGSHRF